MPAYNISIELPLEMTALYSGAETLREVEQLFLEFGATIHMANTSDWEVSDDPESFDAGTANKMMQMNLELYRAALDRVRGTNEWTPKSDVALTPSHTEVIVEASNTTTVEASNTTTTTQETIMNSTINIESMSLVELADLQVKIAARMQQLISETNEDVATVLEEVAESAPKIEKKGAARVKRTTQPAPKVDAARNAEVAAAVAKTDEIVRKHVEAKNAAEKAKPVTTDLSAMKYADLRSFISKATKSDGKAKEIATKVAAQRGQKSWATVGRQGYEEIYNLINK